MEAKVRHWQTSKYPLRIIIRVCFFSYMILAIISFTWANIVVDRTPKVNVNGFEYLTFLGFLGTVLCMIVSTVSEFYEKLRPVKVSLAFFFLVVETMITFMYWGIYLFLGHHFISGLRVPPPLFMDFAAHLAPMLYLIFECFYSRSYGHHLYRNRTLHVILIPVFTLSYFCWITYLFWDTPQDFPYRFLREMPQEGRLIFSVVATVLSLYAYGMVMNSYLKFHRQDPDAEQEEHEDESGSESEDDNDVPQWLRKSLKR